MSDRGKQSARMAFIVEGGRKSNVQVNGLYFIMVLKYDMFNGFTKFPVIRAAGFQVTGEEK